MDNDPEFRDLSRARGFAQRVVTSGFALDVLGFHYLPHASHRPKIGPAAYEAIGKSWERCETESKKHGDAARYFDDWHALKKVASAETLADLISSRPGLQYLRGLDRIRSDETMVLHPGNYIVLPGVCLEALDGTRAERKRSAIDVKLDHARGVLRALLYRWAPDNNGCIHLPGLPIGGTDGFIAERWNLELADSQAQRAAPSIQLRRILGPAELQISGDAIRLYPAHADSACIDYLLSLAFDAEPMPLDVMLRWGLDLTSAILAVRCLQSCETNPANRRKAGVHSSNLAFDSSSLEGLAAHLLGQSARISDQTLCSMVERVTSPISEERMLRAFWGCQTLGYARRVLERFWPMLGTESRHFWRAFKRHAVPTLPCKRTSRGAEIDEGMAFMQLPDVQGAIKLMAEVSDPERPPNPDRSWLATYHQFRFRFLAEIEAMMMAAQGEGRALLRADYEQLNSRLANDRKALDPLEVPAHIRRVTGRSRR